MFQQDQKNHLFYKKESSHWKTRRTTSSAKRKVLTAILEKSPLLQKGKFSLQEQKNHLFWEKESFCCKTRKTTSSAKTNFSLQDQKKYLFCKTESFHCKARKTTFFCKKESSRFKTRKITYSAKKKVLIARLEKQPLLQKEKFSPGLLQFENTVTTNFQKTSLTCEIDYYSHKKLLYKNSGFKNQEKSGSVAILSH